MEDDYARQRSHLDYGNDYEREGPGRMGRAPRGAPQRYYNPTYADDEKMDSEIRRERSHLEHGNEYGREGPGRAGRAARGNRLFAPTVGAMDKFMAGTFKGLSRRRSHLGSIGENSEEREGPGRAARHLPERYFDPTYGDTSKLHEDRSLANYGKRRSHLGDFDDEYDRSISRPPARRLQRLKSERPHLPRASCLPAPGAFPQAMHEYDDDDGYNLDGLDRVPIAPMPLAAKLPDPTDYWARNGREPSAHRMDQFAAFARARRSHKDLAHHDRGSGQTRDRPGRMPRERRVVIAPAEALHRGGGWSDHADQGIMHAHASGRISQLVTGGDGHGKFRPQRDSANTKCERQLRTRRSHKDGSGDVGFESMRESPGRKVDRKKKERQKTRARFPSTGEGGWRKSKRAAFSIGRMSAIGRASRASRASQPEVPIAPPSPIMRPGTFAKGMVAAVPDADLQRQNTRAGYECDKRGNFVQTKRARVSGEEKPGLDKMRSHLGDSEYRGSRPERVGRPAQARVKFGDPDAPMKTMVLSAAAPPAPPLREGSGKGKHVFI